MSRSALFFLLAFALAASAWGQADPFENLKSGDRIQVLLKNNTMFRGEVHWVQGDRIKIDVTYDSTELQGFLTFKRSEVGRVILLQALSDLEKENIASAKQEKLRQFQEEVDARRAADQSAAKAAEKKEEFPVEEYQDLKKKGEEKARLARAALLAKFPRPDWSEEKYAATVGKVAGDRTPEEKEFVDRYAEWLEAGKADGVEERRKLLEKYPPEKGWGPEKMEELRVKELSNLHTGRPTYVGGERQNNGRTRPPVTEEENEFRNRYEEWKLGLKEFIDEQKAEQGEVPVPEGGTPAGAAEGAGGAPTGGAPAGTPEGGPDGGTPADSAPEGGSAGGEPKPEGYGEGR